MNVEYDPSTATISCTFVNELNSSQKSCHVEYGMCDKVMNFKFAQNSTTDSSLSTVTLKLNITAMNSNTCYVVTATNGTFTVIVNGSFGTQTKGQRNNGHLGVIVGSVISAVIVVLSIGLAAVVIVIMVLKHGMLLLIVCVVYIR